MQTEFIKDLDDFFCKKYCDYSHIAAIPGFIQPTVSAENHYAADPKAYLLDRQKNKAELLARFKGSLVDKDFSFSFAPVSLKQRLFDVTRKNTFAKVAPTIFKKYSLDLEHFYQELCLPEEVWKRILSGKYYPQRATVFSIALLGGMNYKDTALLLDTCGHEFNFEKVTDVVVAYLLSYGVYNREMIATAFREYHVTNLPYLAEEKAEA